MPATGQRQTRDGCVVTKIAVQISVTTQPSKNSIHIAWQYRYSGGGSAAPQQLKAPLADMEPRHRSVRAADYALIHEAYGVSPGTVRRDWALAKAWLQHEINKEAKDE
jgi:hypothetical protein